MSQLKSGAILSYLSTFVTLLVALLYTPIMIRLLGQSEYGLYAMIGSIAAYLSVMDMGLGNTIVRYTSRNRSSGDKEFESKLNGFFLILYSAIAVLTIIIGLIILSNIEPIFGNSLSASEIEKAKIMIVILVINFALSFPLSIFGSIMQAYERFVFLKVLAIIRSISIPLVILPFLFMGFGAISMVLITAIINIIVLLFNVYYCFRKIKINFIFEKIDFKLSKEILGYSFFIFFGVIVDQINWNAGQIILGVFQGTASVAVYAIAIQFIRIYLLFSTSLSSLFLPRVSMMVAENSSDRDLSALMIKFGRIQYIIMIYIFSGFVLYGYEFISIWAGSDYSSAYIIILIIMVPITIPLIQNIGLSILQAKNQQGFRSLVLLFIGVLNVIISIPLAIEFDGIGAAIGTGLSYLIGNGIIMNIYYRKKVNLDIPLFWKNISRLTIPVLIAFLIGAGTTIAIPKEGIMTLALNIIIFTLTFSVLMWKFGVNEYEKTLLKSFSKAVKAINT